MASLRRLRRLRRLRSFHTWPNPTCLAARRAAACVCDINCFQLRGSARIIRLLLSRAISQHTGDTETLPRRATQLDAFHLHPRRREAARIRDSRFTVHCLVDSEVATSNAWFPLSARAQTRPRDYDATQQNVHPISTSAAPNLQAITNIRNVIIRDNIHDDKSAVAKLFNTLAGVCVVLAEDENACRWLALEFEAV